MIALVRVDNRLLHGQILETWIPRLGIGQVVVADDEAAASPLARAAMTLCVPPDLPARILAVKDVPWGALAASKAPVLVLVRDVASLVAAHAAGLRPEIAPKVNLGNVHFEPGRRPVTPSVFLSGDEVDALRALAESKAPVLVLVRDVASLVAARAAGLRPEIAPKVNLGNVHFEPGRRPVTPSVFLSGDEVDALRALAAEGFHVEARAIPSDSPAGMGEIERRYAAAP